MRALGRMLRKDHTYLSQLERDRISPSAEMLEEICPAYGVTAWEAVAGKTKEELFREIAGPHPTGSR